MKRYTVFIVASLLVIVCFVLLHSKINADIMVIAGAILAIAAIAIVGKKHMRSPAYSGFGKKMLAADESTMTFADVAANAAAKRSLQGLVDYIKFPDKYRDYGARMPKGVILYGPPGTGKTLLARALAGEAGVPFFALSGSDFVQMYVGVGANRIRELFSNARKAGKCVIFIDEIDALGRRRAEASSEERDQTINALLSEMSGFRSGDGVVVVAATNRMDAIDPALIRPGRFDRKIEVGLPDKDERYDILKLHARNKPISEDIDLRKLAGETCAFSGAALESLMNEAAIIAAERKSGNIENSDIDLAFFRTIAGDDGHFPANVEERCAVALHEAGHTVVMKKLIPGSKLKRISILSAARGAAGYNLAIPEEKILLKKEDIENQIAVLMAGRAAEILIGGEGALTSGASGDLIRAAELAGTMIMDLGMGGEPAVSLRALSGVCGGVRSSEEECRKLLGDMYERAWAILEENSEILIALTEKLIEKEALDEYEIDNFFSDNISVISAEADIMR